MIVLAEHDHLRPEPVDLPVVPTDERCLAANVGVDVFRTALGQLELESRVLGPRGRTLAQIVPERELMSRVLVPHRVHVDVNFEPARFRRSPKVAPSRDAVLAPVMVAERLERLGQRGPRLERLDLGADVDDGLRGKSFHRCAANVLDSEQRVAAGVAKQLGLPLERGRPQIVVFDDPHLLWHGGEV
jgi:hypothetical protein